jgi:hypothetical protein
MREMQAACVSEMRLLSASKKIKKKNYPAYDLRTYLFQTAGGVRSNDLHVSQPYFSPAFLLCLLRRIR